MTAELESGELIGSGRVADVFALGKNVIKLFRGDWGKQEAFREAHILSVLEGADLPLPCVYAVRQIENRWGVEMSRAPDATLSLTGEYLAAWMAELHWRVHQISNKPLTSLKEKLAHNIKSATALSSELRTKLLLQLEQLPDGNCLCHGDFHPGNIMGSEQEPYVVDWLDATSGPADADACRTYLLALHHAPELASHYLDAYSIASGCPVESIISWLPIVAAARLSENVPDEESRLLTLSQMIV